MLGQPRCTPLACAKVGGGTGKGPTVLEGALNVREDCGGASGLCGVPGGRGWCSGLLRGLDLPPQVPHQAKTAEDVTSSVSPQLEHPTLNWSTLLMCGPCPTPRCTLTQHPQPPEQTAPALLRTRNRQGGRWDQPGSERPPSPHTPLGRAGSVVPKTGSAKGDCGIWGSPGMRALSGYCCGPSCLHVGGRV